MEIDFIFRTKFVYKMKIEFNINKDGENKTFRFDLEHVKKNVGRPKETEMNYEDKTGNLNTKIYYLKKKNSI